MATAEPDGFKGFCCGRPHRSADGSIDICLGMPPMDAEARAELIEVEIVGESGEGSWPKAAILASDGAWEPFVYVYGADWLSDDSATGGVGAICGSGAETADDVAGRVLAETVRLGLDDNATIAAALWH